MPEKLPNNRDSTVAKIKYDDLMDGFLFVCAAPPGSNSVYISLETGQIHWTSELERIDGMENVPADLETSDRYIPLPHRYDLNLGTDLVFRFVAGELPAHYEQVQGFFRRKGAYARFKRLLESEGMIEKWHKFESESTDKALRKWCKLHRIKILEDRE
jgi:hypothetical protein